MTNIAPASLADKNSRRLKGSKGSGRTCYKPIDAHVLKHQSVEHLHVEKKRELNKSKKQESKPDAVLVPASMLTAANEITFLKEKTFN